ncbi:MAG: ABC transporter permease [Actinobacteria bacterium]|nr:ABC transporter permease [Actinomycetota bacterium]
MKYLSYLILSLPFVGAYAIFAVGIVVIYRASRVLNLAHGAIAMVAAYLTLSPVKFSLIHMGVPLIPAVLIGILFGALLGVFVERVFVRGLRHMSLTAQTVGTVATLSLLMSVAAKYWGTNPQTTRSVFPDGAIHVGSGLLRYGGIGLFVVSVVLAFAMLALFKFTNLGLAMRGAAVNRRAAALMGINPDRTTSIAWAIGGGLAAISGILLAAITSLEPYQLSLQVLPAFVAALLGGLEGLAAALGGAAIVGFLLGMVPAFASVPGLNVITGQSGAPELVLTILALGVMYMRGQKFSVATRDDGGFTSRGGPRRRSLSVPVPAKILIGIALVAWVWIPGISSELLFQILSNAHLALVYAIIGISIAVLTGWVGQISLGHAALVGVGAFATGVLSRNFGIPFPFNLPLAAVISAGVATLLGAVALRVRGLYLAVATLIFSWMADKFLFTSSWFVGSGGTSTVKNSVFGSPGGFPNFDLSDQKILYFFALAVCVVGFIAMANLRSSKTGRAFFATRGSEMAAASLGINVMRYKLLAFAISGMLAGAAGNLFIIKLRSVSPSKFMFTASLLYLSIAVVGGL